MRVLVTGGTGHSGPYIISDLIAAGHEFIALARSDKSAAAVSAAPWATPETARTGGRQRMPATSPPCSA